MKRWLETHRLRKAARDAMRQLQQARPARYRQLTFNFDSLDFPFLPACVNFPCSFHRKAFMDCNSPVLDVFLTFAIDWKFEKSDPGRLNRSLQNRDKSINS